MICWISITSENDYWNHENYTMQLVWESHKIECDSECDKKKNS